MNIFGNECITENSISYILKKEGLEEVQRLKGGNSGAEIILCKSATSKKVAKIPTNKKSLDEVLSNIKAYDEMIRLGLRENLPETLHVNSYRGMPYIVMSYLGPNFAEEINIAYITDFGVFRVEGLYRILCDSLKKIYEKTVRKDNQGSSYLSMIEQNIIENFEKHLIPAGLSDEEYIKKLKDIKIARGAPAYTCFAPYDFTPEDVFLITRTPIFPDPKGELRGIPQVPLACFAGVARDVYNLHGSFNGYYTIERFASEVVPDIIHISKEQAEYLFTFGRALQCAISSRVRINTEPDRAKDFADRSMEFIDTLYSLDYNTNKR